MSQSFEALMSKLTPREQQICKVVVKDPELTVNGIAQAVKLSRRGAQFHLYNAYDKLGVRSRAGLVDKLKGSERNG